MAANQIPVRLLGSVRQHGERHAISEKEATKKLGTVMFVKGVAAYNEWKNTFNTTP